MHVSITEGHTCTYFIVYVYILLCSYNAHAKYNSIDDSLYLFHFPCRHFSLTNILVNTLTIKFIYQD